MLNAQLVADKAGLALGELLSNQFGEMTAKPGAQAAPAAAGGHPFAVIRWSKIADRVVGAERGRKFFGIDEDSLGPVRSIAHAEPGHFLASQPFRAAATWALARGCMLNSLQFGIDFLERLVEVFAVRAV